MSEIAGYCHGCGKVVERVRHGMASTVDGITVGMVINGGRTENPGRLYHYGCQPAKTSSMVERVARAMAEKSKARQPGMHTLNALKMDGEEDFMQMARAAIEAMREPTEAMSEAMRIANMNVAGGYDGPSGWEAAIDAALKD